jgi:hypothetical protein
MSKKISVKCIETGEEFESIAKATKHYDIGKCCISNCLLGRSKTAGGFHWVKIINVEKDITIE